MLDQHLTKRDGHCVPNLLACCHQSARKHVIIGKSLDTGRLTDGNAVVKRGMHKPAF